MQSLLLWRPITAEQKHHRRDCCIRLRSKLPDYHTGARRFGSNRASGRKHAGIDLYAPTGTAVRAMAAGRVLNVYAFYRNTYAIEIDHGSFIARYGEVDKDVRQHFKRSAMWVARGDKLGKVGSSCG